MRVTSPTIDLFYEPPLDFESAACGTVLRSRRVELGFLGLIRQRVEAWQLLFRTTNAKEQPDAAVTTVIVPRGATAEATGVRVLSYQCAIDAIDPRQFPSYLLRMGASRGVSVPQLEYLLIAEAVARGWVVTVPDHEGRHGKWGIANEPGYVILDGVRACLHHVARSADRTPVALWGYSGGGLASGWGAELAESYAAELNIVGAVLGSPVSDLGSTARRLNGTIFAGLPVVVIAALASEYPEIRSIIDEHASADGLQLLNDVATMSTLGALAHFSRRNLEDYIDITIDELWELPQLNKVLDIIRLGQRAPGMPLLMVQATNDPIISVHDIDSLVDRYRDLGARVCYRRDRLSEHFLAHTISAPLVFGWLEDRYAGVPFVDHDTRTVPSLLTPKNSLTLLKMGLTVLAVCFGRLGTRAKSFGQEQITPELRDAEPHDDEGSSTSHTRRLG